MRVRGVFGYNLPANSGVSVQPANFSVGGVIGRFARGLVSVVDVNNTTELATKCGNYFTGFYGRYVLDTFFKNLRGSAAKLYVKMFVASDAVQAFSTIQDTGGTPQNTLKLSAAFQGIVDKSFDGNQTGYTLTLGTRASTTASANALSGATTLSLASVAQVRVGDILQITSSGPTVHYAKVSAVNEGLKTVTVSATTNAVATNDVIGFLGFQIVTYRKSTTGVVSKIDLPENNVWLSLESENTEFYVNNAFANHPYLALTDLASTNTPLPKRYPATVSSVTFLSSGSNGTSPSSASDWNLYSAFDALPIRYLLNTDTTLTGVNQDGEAYCTGRLDTPIWLYALPAQQSINQYITIGNSYQRSNQVEGVIIAGWRNVSDPIGAGANPVLRIPTHGAVLGAWIYTAFTALGVHQAPAGDAVGLLGFTTTADAAEDPANGVTEQNRTDILAAGVNLVQNIPGVGLSLRSFRTPTTGQFMKWGTDLLLENFIKVSSVESLHFAESRPNRITALQEYGRAIRDFGMRLDQGSFPYGIDPNGAFGTFTKPDGKLATFDDKYTVQADQFNNPNASIQAGEGNILISFLPTPLLESLGIGIRPIIPL
jgi:hypothetical protein